jgi:hypothetical protein
MTLTLELSPELVGRLRLEADRRGRDVSEYVVGLIEQSLPAVEPEYGYLQETLSPEEWSQALREWAESHDRSIPPLSDEVISRESFYGGDLSSMATTRLDRGRLRRAGPRRAAGGRDAGARTDAPVDPEHP